MEGDFIDTVATYTLDNYKKVYVDAIGNTHIDDVLYETNHKKLGEKFLEDWNQMFETTLDPETAFVQGENYSSPFRTSARNNSTTDPTGAKITSFFQDDVMYAKWGWILEYIENELSTGVAFDPCVTQINCIKNNTTDESGNWYYGITLVSYLQSIFNACGTSTGSGRFNFERTVENMQKLALIVNYNDQVYSTFNEIEFVKIGSSYALENLNKENCIFLGYDINSVLYNQSYTVTSDNVLLIPTFTAETYDITYYCDGVELTDIKGSYTIEDTVTLPTITVEGYDFVGWCEDPACSGEIVTKITKGSTGNKVYYAKYIEKQLKEVNVTYDLNGGYFRYESLDAAIADFLKDYNNFAGTSYTAATFHAIDPWLETGKVINFFYNDTYEAKWTWLVDYLATTATNATNKKALEVFYNYTKQSELIAEDNNYLYCVAYEVRGWVGQAQYTLNSNFKSANYAQLIDQSNAAAIGETSYVYKEACDLKIPTKEGYDFAGWKLSIDNSVVSQFPGYLDNPGDITYTAVWKERILYVDSTATEGSVHVIDGVQYVYGTGLFATINDALAAFEDGYTISLLAGTYAENITISKANVTIVGPNEGIPYNETRNTEAVINGTISVSANNFKLDGVSFTGTQIKATKALVDLTILNVISESNGATFNGGRQAVLGSDYALSNLVVKYSKFYVPYAVDGKNGLAFYGTVTNADIQHNSFVNKLTASELNEAILLADIAGKIYVSNNDIKWTTDNYSIFLGKDENSATVIDIKDNVVSGEGTNYHTSGIAVRRIPASTTVNIVGNEIYHMGGNTFNFGSSVSGSKVNISYNYFDAKTSFKCSSKGSATVTTNNNCYAGGITTVSDGHTPSTSSETTYATLSVLKEAYATVE